MYRVDLIERLLHRRRPYDSPVDPDGKENGVHAAFAHTRNIDVPVRIALAKIEILGEETLRGIVVGIQHNRGKVQFVGPLGDFIRRRTAHFPRRERASYYANQGTNPTHGSSTCRLFERVYPTSQPNSACFHACRLISAKDSVSGISLGQAFTQFWALAQSSMPPRPITAWMRSLACIAPVGCILNKRTWLKIAAPMKLLCSLTCGQTSRQFPQVMQRDNG